MTTVASIVRQPAEFKYGEDFDLFFRQFKMFAENVKCEANAQFKLLLSYLDKKSFRLVEGIEFSEEEKTAINADVVAALPKLKKALTSSDKMPAKVELKFRKQQSDESLADFGFAIQSLGYTAFGNNAGANGQVIDAFCMGVKSAALSAKLITADFGSLSDAITFAKKKESAMSVMQYVAENREGSSHTGDLTVLNTEAVSSSTVPQPMPSTQDTGSGGNGNRRPPRERYENRDRGPGSGSSGYRGNRDVQCYVCKKFGHYASECADRTDKACYYCGKVGHLISRCFKKRNDEKYNRNFPQNSDRNFRQGPGNHRA